MNGPARTMLVAIGLLLGGFVGAVLGVCLPAFGGPFFFGPDFYQLGWLFVFFTLPGGALAGAALGGTTIVERPRLFVVTILLLAIFFTSALLIFGMLLKMDRQRTFVFDVTGTNGAQYFGVVSADGKSQEMSGVLPARVELTAYKVEAAFALVAPSGTETIDVDVSLNGELQRVGGSVPTGVELHFECHGYSEEFGGTSSRWHRMWPEEVASLIQRRTLPR